MQRKNKKNIVWLASYPKSGNTWFRIFLSNILAESDQPVNINSLHSSTIASSRTIFEEYTGISSSELTASEIRDLRPRVYRLLSRDTDGDIFIKVHDAWQLNDRSEAFFPFEITKAVIYIIRNPYDVAKSYSNHGGISLTEVVDQMNNCKNIISSSRKGAKRQLEQELYSWSDHVKSWVDYSNLPVHVVRYEDLLTDPVKYFKNALDFMGISCDEHRVGLAVKNSDFEVVRKQEEQFGFKERPLKSRNFFYSGTCSNIELLEGNQLYEKLKNHHSDVMKRYNYFI